MDSLLGQRRACLSCKHKNTDQDPIATKASKRNVKREIGKRVGKERQREEERGKNRAMG